MQRRRGGKPRLERRLLHRHQFDFEDQCRIGGNVGPGAGGAIAGGLAPRPMPQVQQMPQVQRQAPQMQRQAPPPQVQRQAPPPQVERQAPQQRNNGGNMRGESRYQRPQ